MVHIPDDALRFGTLDNCSGFPFENYLYQMKKLVRSGKNPLQQIVRRLAEMADIDEKVTMPKAHSLSTKKPDNAFILQNENCVELDSISDELDENGNNKYFCNYYDNGQPLFETPMDSTWLKNFFFPSIGTIDRRQGVYKLISVKEIQQKAIKYNVNDGIVFHGINHRTEIVQ